MRDVRQRVQACLGSQTSLDHYCVGCVSQDLYFSPSAGYYFAEWHETHHWTIVLYRAPSGALFRKHGTIRLVGGRGLRSCWVHWLDYDPRVQPAMELLADMKVQPANLPKEAMASATAPRIHPHPHPLSSPRPAPRNAGSTGKLFLVTAQGPWRGQCRRKSP